MADEGLLNIFFSTSLVSLLLYIIAFSTTGWHMIRYNTGATTKIGLWDSCVCNFTYWEDQSWFQATQAMTTIAMILFVCAFFFVFVFVQCESLRRRFMLPLVIILGFSTAVFIIIGLSVFGSFITQDSVDGYLGYSFAFAAVAGFGCTLASFVAILLWKSQ